MGERRPYPSLDLALSVCRIGFGRFFPDGIPSPVLFALSVLLCLATGIALQCLASVRGLSWLRFAM